MDRKIMRFFRAMILLGCIVLTIGLWITGFDSDTIVRVFPLYLLTVMFETISFIAEK